MPHHYKIRVKGHLDQSWLQWLGDMVIRHQPDGTTVLTGRLKDQSALYGLLRKIHDMSLQLLSLDRLNAASDEAAPESDEPPPQT
jgi:hypothetical protein